MSLSTALQDLLVQDEGLRLKPYYDTATPPRLTIGVGRNLEDQGISKEEAYYMLQNDVWEVINEVNTAFLWFKGLSEKRQVVVASMVFNLGMTRFLGFRHTIAAIERGDYAEAAREILDSKWARQVGDRADRLAKMMEEG